MGAILGVPYGALGDDPETRELMRLIIAEIYSVARAKGIALHHPEAAGYFRHFLEDLVPPTAAHWPSMWQDLQAGRRTEIEALNGAICRYGRETGVATPYNETMSRLIRFKEYQAAPRAVPRLPALEKSRSARQAFGPHAGSPGNLSLDNGAAGDPRPGVACPGRSYRHPPSRE